MPLGPTASSLLGAFSVLSASDCRQCIRLCTIWVGDPPFLGCADSLRLQVASVFPRLMSAGDRWAGLVSLDVILEAEQSLACGVQQFRVLALP